MTAGTPWVARADMTAPRRGPLTLRRIRVTTSFPFGLFEKSRTFDVEDALLVWPRRGFTCEPPRADPGLQTGEQGTPHHRHGAGDLHGLRELGEREDARGVHWKKSAALGKLIKVERERDDRHQYTLHVEAAAGEALERACEETAALTHQLLSAGHDVGLVAGHHRLRPASGPGHERRVLSALAMLGFEAPRS